MSVIFISHSSKDNALIKDLGIIQALKKAGFENIFLDFDEEKGIKTGEEWKEKLYSKIKKAHIIILLLSPNWIDSKWCFAEYTIAEILGKTIVPIIIDNRDNIVYEWIEKNLKQQADLTSNKEAINLLIKRLKEITLQKQRGYPLDGVKLPYPGLMSFDIKEAAIFFGREKETKDIVNVLNDSEFYFNKKIYHIISASGIGKSSLLKAGVLAYLIYHEKNEWSVLPVMTPTDRPITSLSAVFAKFFDDLNLFEEIKKGFLSEDYKHTVSILYEKLIVKGNKKILLPIDQLEELYMLSDKKEREIFIKIINEFLNKKGFFIITTLRADFLTSFQKDKNLSIFFDKCISDTSLKPLTEQGIIDVIKKPAELFGIEVEEGLVDRLRKDMGDVNALPLLAFTLEKLYREMLKEDKKILNEKLYATLGDKQNKNPMQNIINAEADNAYKEALKLKKIKEIDIKNLFLKKLIDINLDEKISKKILSIKNLTQDEEKILESFVNRRLIIKDKDNVSIIHESFIESWNKLKNWIANEKTYLIAKKKIEYEYKEWIRNKKKKAYLLSGANLQNALNALKESPELFNNEEKVYIKKSRRYSLIKKFFLRISIFIIMIIFTIIFYLTFSVNSILKNGGSITINLNPTHFFSIETKNKISMLSYKIKELNQTLMNNYKLNKRLNKKFINSITDILIKNLDKNVSDLLAKKLLILNKSWQIYNKKNKKFIINDFFNKLYFDLNYRLKERINNHKKINRLLQKKNINLITKFLWYHTNINNEDLKNIKKFILLNKNFFTKNKFNLTLFLVEYHLGNFAKALTILKTNKLFNKDYNYWKYYFKIICHINKEKDLKQFLIDVVPFENKNIYLFECKNIKYNIYFLKWLIKNYKNKMDNKKLALIYGSLSWYEILNHNYKNALKYIQTAIKLDKNNLWLKINLAHALLLNGYYNKAQNNYLNISNNLFPNWLNIVVNDFKTMLKYNIYSEKIMKIRNKILLKYFNIDNIMFNSIIKKAIKDKNASLLINSINELFKYNYDNLNKKNLNLIYKNLNNLNISDKQKIDIMFLFLSNKEYLKSLNILKNIKKYMPKDIYWEVYFILVSEIKQTDKFNEFLKQIKPFENKDIFFVKGYNLKYNFLFFKWLMKNYKNKMDNKKLAFIYGNLSWYEILNHNYKNALKYIQTAIKLDKNNLWLKEKLAIIYFKTKQYEKFKKFFIKIDDKSLFFNDLVKIQIYRKFRIFYDSNDYIDSINYFSFMNNDSVNNYILREKNFINKLIENDSNTTKVANNTVDLLSIHIKYNTKTKNYINWTKILNRLEKIQNKKSIIHREINFLTSYKFVQDRVLEKIFNILIINNNLKRKRNESIK